MVKAAKRQGIDPRTVSREVKKIATTPSLPSPKTAKAQVALCKSLVKSVGASIRSADDFFEATDGADSKEHKGIRSAFGSILAHIEATPCYMKMERDKVTGDGY